MKTLGYSLAVLAGVAVFCYVLFMLAFFFVAALAFLFSHFG